MTKLAVLYHGAYYRTPYGPDGRPTHTGMGKCTDYFQAADNHEERLLGPLRVTGAKLFTFLHTFASCPHRDEELVRALKPTRTGWSIERAAQPYVPPNMRIVPSG